MRFVVANITDGQGEASIIDAIDPEYAATVRGQDGADVYVFPEAKARLFRKALQPILDEVPDAERADPPPDPAPA